MEENDSNAYSHRRSIRSTAIPFVRQSIVQHQSPNLPNIRQALVTPKGKTNGLHVSNSAYNLESPTADNAQFFR